MAFDDDDGPSFADLLRTAMAEGWGHPEGVRWTLRALAEHTGVHYATVFRWRKGESNPQYDTLRLALDRWDVGHERRRRLLLARDNSDTRSARNTPAVHGIPTVSSASSAIATEPATRIDAVSDGDPSEKNGSENVKRRELLLSTGALLTAPLSAMASVAHTAERYEAARTLAESVGLVPRAERLQMARKLDVVCARALANEASRTNHLIASMAGSMLSIILHHDEPEEARAIAQRASANANAAGQNIVQLWSATAEALCARKLHDPRSAIQTLESVANRPAERGTMQIFATSCLAEAYGDLGDYPNVLRCMQTVDKLRQAVRMEDEFGGLMTFPGEQEAAHSAEALLGAGQYTSAIKYAAQTLAMYADMPAEQQRFGYMRNACVTVAAAAARIE
ncbi:MAG: helix-turn-helix transcriptional regulator [Myxococcota bacterium]